MSHNHLIHILEEQLTLQFTGRINILSGETRQFLGHILISEGEIIHCNYNQAKGIKAFYKIFIDAFGSTSLKYIVEPELVDPLNRSIHYPFGVLKKKLTTVITNYEASKKQAPPQGIKLLIKPEFISSGENITPEEYKLLLTISDYNSIDQIYKNSPLLDYEITNTLVSLRKKQALLVVKSRNS